MIMRLRRIKGLYSKCGQVQVDTLYDTAAQHYVVDVYVLPASELALTGKSKFSYCFDDEDEALEAASDFLVAEVAALIRAGRAV
jgi:hypothetical protein